MTLFKSNRDSLTFLAVAAMCLISYTFSYLYIGRYIVPKTREYAVCVQEACIGIQGTVDFTGCTYERTTRVCGSFRITPFDYAN